MTAVVPLRDGVSGKSRLATALEPAGRRRLVVTLARHVLDVLAASGSVDRVVVVTADPAFVAEVLGADAGRAVEVLAEPAGRQGLNAALEHAREVLRRRGTGRLLVVHADLPLLAADDVAAVLAAPADVVVATDRHGAGTNLLAVPLDGRHRTGTGGGPFRFRFGVGSRSTHVAEAAAHGLTADVVDRPGTALDLDTLADWDDLPTAVRDRLRVVVGALPS